MINNQSHDTGVVLAQYETTLTLSTVQSVIERNKEKKHPINIGIHGSGTYISLSIYRYNYHYLVKPVPIKCISEYELTNLFVIVNIVLSFITYNT